MMIKKITKLTFFAGAALALGACSTNNSSNKEVPQKQESSHQIPSPWVDLDSIEEAEKLAGFKFDFPNDILEGYSQKSIEAVKNDIIQVTYENGTNEIILRQSKGDEDISGDTNDYTETNTLELDGLNITTKGSNSKINTTIWSSNDFSYAILSNLEKEGIDSELIKEIVSKVNE